MNFQKEINRYLASQYLLLFVVMFGITSCDSKEEALAPDFSQCNEELTACVGLQDGTYCLFGLKWGADARFDNSGVEAIGPQSPGGTITFSFVTESTLVSNVSDSNLQTVPFDDKGECARDQARAALADWEKYGDFSFQEVADNSPSDIRFIAANGVVEALGNPNYHQQSCRSLRGDIFFSGSRIPCDFLYTLCLHEIGHVLGLGHVSSSTIMGIGASQGISTLQEGDIEGVQAIYGEK